MAWCSNHNHPCSGRLDYLRSPKANLSLARHQSAVQGQSLNQITILRANLLLEPKGRQDSPAGTLEPAHRQLPSKLLLADNARYRVRRIGGREVTAEESKKDVTAVLQQFVPSPVGITRPQCCGSRILCAVTQTERHSITTLSFTISPLCQPSPDTKMVALAFHGSVGLPFLPICGLLASCVLSATVAPVERPSMSLLCLVDNRAADKLFSSGWIARSDKQKE